ncbi:MAG: LysE family translocator [Alphaproteobacteria bacterium]|nr:LysE family translocator [Alphaproteobacteria bacterium]
MPSAALLSLCWLAFIGSVTPGPNNIMLAASGVNFGIRASVPQMAGIFVGIVVVTLASGFGLGAIFSAYPLVRDLMRLAGFAYVVWLAWRIAIAGSLGGGDLPHPMRFSTSLSIQPLNLKLWMTAIAVVALYVRPGHTVADTLTVAAAFSLLNLPCMVLWAGCGALLREALKLPGRVRVFNLIMAAALLASVVPLLWG